MRPAHRIALGAVFACMLGLAAHRFTSPASAATTARASASVAQLSSPEKTPDDRLLLTRRCLALSERDPLAAMDMAVAKNLTDADPGLLASLVNQWAIKDFDGACKWIKTQESGAWRDDMLARLACLRAQTDPLDAARLVTAEILPNPARDEALISVLHQWALQDPETAEIWAGSFSDDKLKSRALAELHSLQARGLAARRD